MRHVMAVPAVLICAAGVAFGQATANATFDHYEAIRMALSIDSLNGIGEHAAALAPLAAEAAGADAKKAADLLGAAADLKAAREQFGILSAALLPTFEKAQLTDVYLYTCSMVKQSWAQRGRPVQNPYMGKAMATCRVPAKPSK